MQRLARLCPLPAVEHLPISLRGGVEESAELIPELRMQSAVYLGLGGRGIGIVEVIVYLLQGIVFLLSDPVFVAMPAHIIRIKPRFLEAF